MRITIFFLALLVFLNGFSQKFERAAEAFSDKKLNKAADLFQDVLKKNPDNAVALVGLPKTMLEMIQTQSFRPAQSELVETINLIKKADNFYFTASPGDKALMLNKLGIGGMSDLDQVRSGLSTFLWNEYLSSNTDLDTVQYYFDNYIFGKWNKELALSKLMTLSYSKASAINTIESYQQYISKYPSSSQALIAAETIENLELEKAKKDLTISGIETFLAKYPANKEKGNLEKTLAELYTKGLSEESAFAAIKTAQEKLKKLAPENSKVRLLFCAELIFKKEFKSILSANDLGDINAFIEKYKYNTSYDISKVRSLRTRILRDKLLSGPGLSYSSCASFIQESQSPVEYCLPILEKISADLKERSVEGLKDYISNYVQTIQIPSEKQAAFIRLIQTKINWSPEIDRNAVFILLNSTAVKDDNILLQQLVQTLNIYPQMLRINFYFLPIDYSWNVINTTLYSEDGARKSGQLYYSQSTQSYIEVKDPGINYHVFEAIKQRFGLIRFASPKITESTDRGVIMRLYGFTPTDQGCCPSQVIFMNYVFNKGNLVPEFARSIDPFYGRIEEETTAGYYQFGSNLLYGEGAK